MWLELTVFFIQVLHDPMTTTITGDVNVTLPPNESEVTLSSFVVEAQKGD